MLICPDQQGARLQAIKLITPSCKTKFWFNDENEMWHMMGYFSAEPNNNGINKKITAAHYMNYKFLNPET